MVLSTANDLSVEPIGWTILQRLPLTQNSTREFARELVGLGFAFDLDKTSHTLQVTKIYPKSPASQAGITAGQVIQQIDAVPTLGKTVADCLTHLRANGRPKVRLELVDLQRNETNTVEVTRGKFLTFNP